MRILRLIIFFWIGLSLTLVGLSNAQPNVSKKTIPATVPEDVRKKIEKLYAKDQMERIEAAEALGEMGSKAAPAIHYLIGLLGDRTASVDLFGSPVGLYSAFALSKIGEQAVNPLITALKDKDAAVRGHAIIALRDIKDTRAVNPLIFALKDKDIRVCQYAAEALGEINDGRAVEPLIAVLEDKNKTLLTKEVWTFDVHGNRVVKHEKILEGAQAEAAKALGKIKDKRALAALISALKDEDADLKIIAAWALGNIEDKQAVEPLITALKDSDYTVRRNVAETLEKLTGQTLGDTQDKWTEWWEQNKEIFIKTDNQLLQ